jgi:hypothetical protein
MLGAIPIHPGKTRIDADVLEMPTFLQQFCYTLDNNQFQRAGHFSAMND